jgi:hypothetical protein
VSKTKVFYLITASLFGFDALMIQPVVAGERWQKVKEFQQQKIQPFLDKHRIQMATLLYCSTQV